MDSERSDGVQLGGVGHQLESAAGEHAPSGFRGRVGAVGLECEVIGGRPIGELRVLVVGLGSEVVPPVEGRTEEIEDGECSERYFGFAGLDVGAEF